MVPLELQKKKAKIYAWRNSTTKYQICKRNSIISSSVIDNSIQSTEYKTPIRIEPLDLSNTNILERLYWIFTIHEYLTIPVMKNKNISGIIFSSLKSQQYRIHDQTYLKQETMDIKNAKKHTRRINYRRPINPSTITKSNKTKSRINNPIAKISPPLNPADTKWSKPLTTALKNIKKKPSHISPPTHRAKTKKTAQWITA